MDAEPRLDFVLDAVAEGDDISGCGVPAIDERKSVAGGDSSLAEGESFVEAGAFEQPCGGELDLAVRGGPVGDGSGIQVELGGDLGQGAGWDDGVFEEGACAAAVLLAFNEEHALAVTNLADGVVDIDGFGWSSGVGEVGLEVGVGEVRCRVEVEVKLNPGNNISAAMGGVEDATAIGEFTFLSDQVLKGMRFKV